MDVKISTFAMWWKWLWGGKEAVFEYLLDKGNTLVAMIPDADKARLAKIRDGAVRVQQLMDEWAWVCPAKWQVYYCAILRCYAAVVDALKDGKVERAELDKVVAEFQSAYAVWKAED